MIKRRKITSTPPAQPDVKETTTESPVTPMPAAPELPPAELPTAPVSASKSIPWRWLLVALAVVGVGSLFWYLRSERPRETVAVVEEVAPEDPRLTFVTPYRNVRPDVKYVGDQACAGCHREVTHSFHQHSMGRSISTMAELAPKQQYDESKNNPFQALGKEYRVERNGDKVVHRETYQDAQGKPLVETQVEAQYAIGSGAHAHSYLFLRDDRVVQSPITWYPQKQRWDMSPGFLSVENADNAFSRPVGADCLFCHSNHVDLIEGSMNRYKMPLFPRGQAIGCERCHGPGSLHVSERSQNISVADHVDYSIVNPKHLEPELREAVCQQCHLEGNQRVMRRGRQPFDFRPGLPLHLFYSTLVLANDQTEEGAFTGQVEQMYESKCFIASQGKMGCVTCHNPHEPLAQIKPSLYRQQCINCHQDKGCSLTELDRQKNQDNCIACHMPRKPSTDIQHTAITDHRILKKKAAHARETPLKPGQSPLVLFKTGKLQLDEAEAQRDMGIGLSELVKQPSPENKPIAEMALAMLEASLKRWPNDPLALEAKAFLLFAKGEPQVALETIERVLARTPQRESALSTAATLAMQSGDQKKALDYSEQAVKLNPYLVAWQYRLAQLYLQQKDFDKAIHQCQEALTHTPGSVRIRMLLTSALVQSGQAAQAKEEFDTVMQLNPPNKGEFKQWFERQQK